MIIFMFWVWLSFVSSVINWYWWCILSVDVGLFKINIGDCCVSSIVI